jgi:acyl-CoA thioester hydrolase
VPEHSVRVRVRYGETDQMGVVYHPNYFLYFETGRTELLREAGLAYSELEKSGVFLVVTEASCTYRSAARYDEELEIRTRVDHVGKATIGFSYRVLGPTGALLTEGRTVLASVDASKSPVRLPSKVVELLSPAAGPAERRGPSSR